MCCAPHAGHTIAAGLLAAYLGGDAGRRVHAGAVVRGSVESIRAALCFADIRGWTGIADAQPGREHTARDVADGSREPPFASSELNPMMIHVVARRRRVPRRPQVGI